MVQGEKGHHFCKLCGKYFTSSQRWSKHMKDIHSDLKVGYSQKKYSFQLNLQLDKPNDCSSVFGHLNFPAI